MDFSHHIGTIHDPLFQETQQSPHIMQQEDRLDHSGVSSHDPGGGVFNHKEPPTTLTDRLFQLQGHLYRLLSAEEDQPGVDSVQQGLEAAKSLLDILQLGLAPQSNTTTESNIFSAGRQTNNGGLIPPESNQDSNSLPEIDPKMLMGDQSEPPSVSYITVQQALICYSNVLLLLDRVVGGLTNRAGVGDVSAPSNQESRAALHLGIFSLASQPALNNEIVLHLVLCIVQHLRGMIHMLASKCKDLVWAVDQTSTGVVSEKQTFKGTDTSSRSIAVVLSAVSDLVTQRETLLVEKLKDSHS